MNYGKLIESVKRDQRKICAIQLGLTRIEHAASIAHDLLKISIDEGESTMADRDTLKLLRKSLSSLRRLSKRWRNGLGEKITRTKS